MQKDFITRGELVELTGASPTQIDYLKNMRRLKILRPPSGPGFPIHYKRSEAIAAVEAHLVKMRNRK